jgi:hypothetical protein
MGDERLWKDLGFPSFDDYITKIHREFAKSRSKAFNLLAVYQLTKGDNAIPAEMVDRMGQKKAVELTRLQPHQRTPDVIAVALTQPLSKVRNVVTARRNETLPPHEQKPMVRMFALLLPEDTCDELNELLDEMEYAEGVRDGDMTRTLRQKAMDAIVKGARLFYQQELAEAAEYRAAKEAFDARTGVEADEDEEQL